MSTRDDSGLTPKQQAILARRAAKGGWLNGQRWATRTPTAKVIERVKTAEHVDAATLALHGATKLILSGGSREVAAGVRAVIAMEAQNQADEHVIAEAALADDAEARTAEQVRREMLDDPTYAEYLRERQFNGRTGYLRLPSQPGSVAAGETPDSAGEGAD